MDDKKYSEQELQSGLNAIYDLGSYLSIVSVLQLMDSSIHLSRLATLIGKTKSTTLSHLDTLLNLSPPFIELDAERTLNTRGPAKYYRLTEFGRQAMQYQSKQLQKQSEQNLDFGSFDMLELDLLVKKQMINLIENFGASGIANYFKLGAELNLNIETLASNQYTDLAERIYKEHEKGKKLEEMDPLPITPGLFLNRSIQVKVCSTDHIERIKKEAINFVKRIRGIEKEFSQEIDQQISEEGASTNVGVQHIYLGLAPIFKE